MNYKPAILVIDDSEAFAMYISLFLNRLGFVAMPTRNGAEALGLLKVIKPDIVVVDAALKEVNGIAAPELLFALEQHSSKVPVILTYNDIDGEGLKKCLELPHIGCLAKPLRILEFNKLIEHCVTSLGTPRRKSLRATFNKEITVTCEEDTHTYYAISISEGGLYIRSLADLAIGSEVRIAIQLTDAAPVQIKGRVIYRKDVYTDVFKAISGVAIEFVDLSGAQIDLLRAYILDLLVGDIMKERKEIFSIGLQKENAQQ